MRVLHGRSRHHKQNEGGQDKHLQDHSRGLALGVWFGLKATTAPLRGTCIYLFSLPLFGTICSLRSFPRR